MSEFNAQEEIASLRAMLSDVVSKQSRQAAEAAQTGTQAATTPSSAPFWDVTVCSGLTLTAAGGVDWDALFDNTSATSWRKFHLVTAHGDLDFGALGLGPQRRFRIGWDSARAASVKCILAGAYVEANDTDNPIQIKFNGVMTEYPVGTPQFLTLEVKEGQNTLVISADTRPATLQFFGALWDETRGDSWVDPRSFPDYLR